MEPLSSASLRVPSAWSPGDVAAAAQRSLDIWWRLPHTLNNYVAGAVELPEDDRAFREAMSRLGLLDGHESEPSPFRKVQTELRLRRFVAKSPGVFAKDALEAVELRRGPGAVSAHFRPLPLAGGTLRYPSIEKPFAVHFRFGEGVKERAAGPGDRESGEETQPVELSMEWSGGSASNGKWMRETLLPKLRSWFLGSLGKTEAIGESHRLLDLDAYMEVYAGLKRRHGRRLVEGWPERTDPQKFVYEDLATAAYLIALWQSLCPDFAEAKGRGVWAVDVGCGNGLLCHVLASEGIRCLGLDVRKRKIWDHYGPETELREAAVDPSAEELVGFPSEARWLIGNHSDELTPWLAVLAARTGASFFLLPCCPWDFYGKFSRRVEGQSQYRAYLAFLAALAERLGFRVLQDRLKIPSTKRLCLIGQAESSTSQAAAIAAELREAQRLFLKSTGGRGEGPRPAFLPRPAVEAVLNCSRLPKDLREGLVDRLGLALAGRGPDASVSLEDAAGLLTDEEKAALRAQNGGLQTLLRNHAHLFAVRGGAFALRQPALSKGAKAKHLCWWHRRHPQGCPNRDGDCLFVHEDG